MCIIRSGQRDLMIRTSVRGAVLQVLQVQRLQLQAFLRKVRASEDFFFLMLYQPQGAVVRAK
jgi:hypothetical protein